MLGVSDDLCICCWVGVRSRLSGGDDWCVCC